MGIYGILDAAFFGDLPGCELLLREPMRLVKY
jgi:hypothetical protein